MWTTMKINLQILRFGCFVYIFTRYDPDKGGGGGHNSMFLVGRL